MDQWEGQHFNFSPGNLVSRVTRVTRVTIKSKGKSRIKLNLYDVIRAETVPENSKWVHRVKIKSQLLTKFWGRPVFLGATILLPRGYETHKDVSYPTVYCQGHFNLQPPLGFRTDPIKETAEQIARRTARGLENGYQLYQSWASENFPRMICVTFQHPTPFFDDSYAVNSANNGPYADALIQELIPHLEKTYRMIPEGYARVLTGGSTGGYEAMALQVHHPRTFGGSWIFYPDPVDFRSVFQVNMYEDTNAFSVPGFGGLKPERIAFRSPEGQPIQTIRQLSQLQSVMGSRGRSGDYLNAWEASFGPVGDDGYPQPLWDKTTGNIDRDVAQYWRDNGYDLTQYVKTHWPRIGNDLKGKLHLYVGDMDNYYFNLSVLLAKQTLEELKNPLYGGSVQLGSPLKAHGWHPMNNASLLKIMAGHITSRAAAGTDTDQWKY
jgi:hypothetical protein